jgi:hypothetical protein
MKSMLWDCDEQEIVDACARIGIKRTANKGDIRVAVDLLRKERADAFAKERRREERRLRDADKRAAEARAADVAAAAAQRRAYVAGATEVEALPVFNKGALIDALCATLIGGAEAFVASVATNVAVSYALARGAGDPKELRLYFGRAPDGRMRHLASVVNLSGSEDSADGDKGGRLYVTMQYGEARILTDGDEMYKWANGLGRLGVSRMVVLQRARLPGREWVRVHSEKIAVGPLAETVVKSEAIYRARLENLGTSHIAA